MKKAAILAFALVCAVIFAGCGEMRQHTCCAVVTEVGEAYMRVRIAGGGEYDLFDIGLSSISDGSTPPVGDTYEIKYRGGYYETFPAQFQKLVRVSRVEKQT